MANLNLTGKIASLLVLCFSALPVQAALVSGFIKNASPGAVVELVVPHYYLDGRIVTYRGILDGQSRFAIEANVPEPGMAFFVFNDDRLPIFLAEEDSLTLKTDAFQFPVIVSFSGKNGANNRLFQEYLKHSEVDFNEFNNIRFKIGQAWIAVEDPMKGRMESIPPALFKSAMDAQRNASRSLVEAFTSETPEAFSPLFLSWLDAEITYHWAYNLLVYGQVYGGRFGIQPDFFDFLYEAPIVQELLGSDSYRQFIMAFMARQQVKTGQTDNFWSGQYYLAEKLLSGKSLAFFHSELIATAFSTEHFPEVLPLYNRFIEKNPFIIFDDKVEGLYQKYAPVSPGAAAPLFEGSDLNGRFISLAQFRGKIVYLNFWASWCGACLRKMEFFDEFTPELQANGIEIINISIDQNPNSWESSLASHLFKGHHLLASSGTNRNVAQAYGVEAIPQYFIIGKNGLFEVKAPSSQPNDIRQKLLEISEK